MPKGPFPTGTPVEGDEFIGREKETKLLLDLLKGGQSVIIASPRRYGKTSLIIEVLKRLKREGVFTAELDLFGISSKRELAEQIVEKVLLNRKGWVKGLLLKLKEGITRAIKNPQLKSVIGEFEFILSFSDPKINEDDLLGEAFDFSQRFAEKNKKNFVFSYDEFQDILKLNGDILVKKMRTKFQRHANVSYIFAGSQESLMKNLFTNPKEAFYKFGRIIYLDVIEEKVFKNHIKKTYHKCNFDCPDAIIDGLLKISECHPYYTQLICQQIYYSLLEKKRKIDEKDLSEGVFGAVLAERSGFDALWSNLSERKHDILLIKHIALTGESPYQLKDIERQRIYQALQSLEFRGIIKRLGKGNYAIKDPLFNQYIKFRKDGILI